MGRFRVADNLLPSGIETNRPPKLQRQEAQHNRHVHAHVVEHAATRLLARPDAIQPLAFVAGGMLVPLTRHW